MSQPSSEPSWKQEVNQRLAAHKTRKGLSVVAEPAPSETPSAANSRAAKAAARVAARFAHAPSYSDMQAAEARAALRVAEAATRAALAAQAAAQVALDNLETSHHAPFAGEEDLEQGGTDYAATYADETAGSDAAFVAAPVHDGENRSDPEIHDLLASSYAAAAAGEREEFEPIQEDAHQASDEMRSASAHEPFVTVVPAQPIYANLIQFPREIIATRRVRPRIAGIEAGTENELSGQLSIFEVDPATVSTEAAAPGAEAAGGSWAGPEWSGIQLDAQPDRDAQMEAEAAAAAPKLDLAPFGLRLMAAVVDTALIAAFVCADAAMVAAHMKQPPTIKAAELGGVVAMIAAGALYHWLFLTLGEATPGMRYARISLCTFDDEVPSRDQIRKRLGAMVLSLLPVGLGVGWAIFDDDRLTWHDRLSRTYQRRY